MPDLSLRLSTRCTMHSSTPLSNFTMRFLRWRIIPFNFAHLSRDVSSTFGLHDVTLSVMNSVGNHTTEAIAMIAL